jgi:hypothetical protein
MGRAVGPWSGSLADTQGVALGWYGYGPLALNQPAPKARFYTSLGHRPRIAAPKNIPRAKGPPYTSEGQRPSTGASPQDCRNQPT